MSIEEFVRRQRDLHFKAFIRMKGYLGRCEDLRAWLESSGKRVDPEIAKQAKRDLLFYERAAENCEKAAREKGEAELLRDWEAGLSPELREKLHDVKYLPTRDEALQLPEAVRLGSWREDFFDHEVWNREYIAGLADCLFRAVQKKVERGETAVVLDVGAGSGRLAFFLKRALAEKLEPEKSELIKVIGVDKTLEHKLAGMEVEKIELKEAGEKYKPDVVISSWPVAAIREVVSKVAGMSRFLFIGEPELVPFWDGREGFMEFPGFKSRELSALKKLQTGVEKGCTTVEWVRGEK